MNKWDKRFIDLCQHISTWSRDPRTKVGAVIVDKNKRVVSLGFNGFPIGIKDDKRLDDRETKNEIVIHAEINALLFANSNLEGCTLYVWPMPPCIRCAVQIIQSGIKRVVSPICNREHWIESSSKAIELMKEAGINIEIKEIGEYDVK